MRIADIHAPPSPICLPHHVLAFCVLSLFALPCHAEETPIATAAAGAAPAPLASPIQTLSPAVSARPEDEADLQIPDRRVHGQVEMEVGTGGYRRASAVVAAPIGQSGGIVIAVDKTEGRRRFW